MKYTDFKSLDALTLKTGLFLVLSIHSVNNASVIFIFLHNLRQSEKSNFKINSFKTFLVIKEVNVSQL